MDNLTNSHSGTPRSVSLSISAVVAAVATLLGLALSTPAQAAQRWLPPLNPVRVIRVYDPPAHDWLPGHRGIDLAGEPGQEVRAAGAGKVSFAAVLAGRPVVVVLHGALRTTYEPVKAVVRAGELVKTGEVIGHLATGSGHCGAARCLHFGLRRGDLYLNPLLLFGWQAVLRPPNA